VISPLSSTPSHGHEVELRVPWYSIRFQISLLLLLSALNAIVVVAYAVALVTSQPGAEGLTGPGQPTAVVTELTPLHRRFAAGQIGTEELEPSLSQLGGLLLQREEEGSAALVALGAYRDAIPGTVAGLERGEPDAAQALNGHFHSLIGAVYLMDEPSDPAYPEARSRWLVGALLLWVVAVAGVTVASSFRLRRVLSRPLSSLSRAAITVASGELDTPIPSEGVAEEFHQLGVALETMRRELVHSIARLDHQNMVVKAMLDSLGDGVLLLDRARHVMEYNPSAARHLRGIAPPDLARARRLPVGELLPGLEKELFLSRSGVPVQLRFELEGGIERYLEVSVERLEGMRDDLERAYVMVVRDVTRTVELDKLQRNFLSVVTHELKTPLTVIEGYVRLLQMGKGGDLSPKQAEMLGKVRAQSEVLKMMVQDLLDTTRLEGGHLKIERQLVPPARVAAKVVDAMKPEALSRRLGISLEIQDDARVEVLVDEFRLEQVLGNLLRNAFKFTEAGGSIELGVARRDESLELWVSDTGRGIPSAALPRLFEKFYQVEASDTRKAGGAGLGLYICDQLVRAMGGTIAVRSQVGEGSRFTITFPIPVLDDINGDPRSTA
jgi:two-component system sensor histidine kinase VicK